MVIRQRFLFDEKVERMCPPPGIGLSDLDHLLSCGPVVLQEHDQTDQFSIFEALASSHIRRLTFQFVHCCSFRVQRRPCFLTLQIVCHLLQEEVIFASQLQWWQKKRTALFC